MNGKFTSLVRWWYLPPLLTILLSAVSIFLFPMYRQVFNFSLGSSVLLLLLQLFLLIFTLIDRKWWHALGIFVGSTLSAAMVALSVVVLMVSNGIDNVHGKNATTASFDFHENQVNCSIQAAVPDSALSLAVGEWMDEELGGYYPGDATDMEAIVEFYGNALCDTLRQALENGAPEVEFDAKMVKAYETPQFVTYTLSTCMGLGGAHPVSAERGATFRKSDGRRITWDIIRHIMRYSFNDVLVEMLCNYFDVKDETELEGMLMSADVYDLPLPETPPLFLKNGLVVIYQQYEIAGYAMGMPGDTIPYERMKPFMTEWSKRLIE